ncbi:MAG: hypothetical protein M1608_14165 [Candidatus Omnitrophica bacterium]|nr:hypothetical protein [Candidatus Omnitrophota bacterium]
MAGPSVRFLSLLCLAVWAAEPRAAAQTPPVLDIQTYAGLTITGAVGHGLPNSIRHGPGPDEQRERLALSVMGSNRSWFNGDRTAEGDLNYGTDLSRPVELVSWNDATYVIGGLCSREREHSVKCRGFSLGAILWQ